MNEPIPIKKIKKILIGRREPQISRGTLHTQPVETWRVIGDDGVRIPPGAKPAGVLIKDVEEYEE